MALTLDDSQRMLLDSARSFIGERAPIAHLRKLRDSRSPDGFDRGLWREFAEMGFAGVLVPEAQGGMGLGLVEAGILMETIGRTLMPSPFSRLPCSARARSWLLMRPIGWPMRCRRSPVASFWWRWPSTRRPAIVRVISPPAPAPRLTVPGTSRATRLSSSMATSPRP